MPPVVGAVAAAAVGTLLAPAASFAVFGALFVKNLALGLVAQALSPKPKTPAAIARETQDNTQTVRSPIASRKLVYGRTRVGGTMVYLETTGDDNKYLHMVLALAPHQIDGLEKVYFDDELVWDGSYQSDWSSYARLNFHDGSQTTSDSNLTSESAHWTNSHILNETAYLYVRLTYDRDKFAGGIPNVSAVIRGKKVYDPRSGTTAWSQNPALCIRDYLTDSKYGMSVDSSELNTGSWNAAANLCDETVTTSLGSQARYKLDGVVDTANGRGSIIESMLTSLGGSLVYSGGQFYVDGASYNTPVVEIDESMIVDAIQIQTRRSRREAFNGVKGVFSSIEDNYVLSDYPAIISSAYVASDGEPIYLDVDLPYTTDVTRAERIAKLSLLRSRKQITASVRCNLSAIALKAGDSVMISNDRMGWSSKVFEITDLSFEADNEGRLSVLLNVIETDPAVYDWTTSDEIEFIAGQPTTLASPSTVLTPSDLVVNTVAEIQEDGTARPALDISFTNNDAYASTFEIQFNKDGGGFQSILTSETTYRIQDVEVDASYSVRVYAINRLGARSGYVTDSITGQGDTVAPSAPSGLTATGDFGGVVLEWTNPTDSDLDVIEIYESTDSIQSNSSLVATTKSSAFTRGGLSDGVTRYYWLRAIDYSGNRSGFNSATGVSATTLIPVNNDRVIGRIETVDTLTTGLGTADEGKVEFLTTDQTLYKWTGSAWTDTFDIDETTGQILAQQIDVASLSAITADIGTVTAGVVKSSDDLIKLDLTNKRLTLEDGSSNEILRIGDDGSGNSIVRVSDASGNSTAITPDIGTVIAQGTTTISGVNGDGTLGNAINLGATYDFSDLSVIMTLRGYRPNLLLSHLFYGTSYPNTGLWSKYDLLLGPNTTYRYYEQSGADATTGRQKYVQNTSLDQFSTSQTIYAGDLYKSSVLYHAPFVYWEKGSQTSSDEIFITSYIRYRHFETDTGTVRMLYNHGVGMTVDYIVVAKNYAG